MTKIDYPVCPFCGQPGYTSNRRVTLQSTIGPEVFWSIGCHTKNCFGANDDCQYFSSENEAIASWSKRAPEPVAKLTPDNIKLIYQMVSKCDDPDLLRHLANAISIEQTMLMSGFNYDTYAVNQQ